MAYKKLLKERGTDISIYPITRAECVLESDGTDINTHIDNVVNNLSTNIDEIQSALDAKANISDLSNVLSINAENPEIDDINISNSPVDLSMFDVFGNPIEQSTANCYVIRKPGVYKFPIVYGNAIKEGEVNSGAYTSLGKENQMKFFVNYKGSKITSPYIIEDIGGNPITSATFQSVDTGGVFTDLKIIDGSTHDQAYVQFKVRTVPDTGANAVISIHESEQNNIVWSWHIWVWKDNLTPVSLTNRRGVTCKVLPVNLASKWDTSNAEPTKIKNWFYQYGRPTPFLCPKSSESTEFTTNYGKTNLVVQNTASQYEKGIQNPTTFYTGSQVSNGNWFGNTYYNNLWDQDGASGYGDNNVIKTIYDPSPVGFKVPNSGAFDVQSESFTWNGNGVTYKNMYFPTGYMSSSGKIFHVGLTSVIPTAAISYYYDTFSVYCLNLNEYGISYSNSETPLSCGLPLRPIVDEPIVEESSN